MEKELNLPTCLFGGPPDREDLVKLAESQIGFMSIFAGPLFEAITVILPAMDFATIEIESNRTVWEEKIHVEKLRRGSIMTSPFGQPSPLARTPLSVPEEDHEESKEDDVPPERDSLFGPSRTSQVNNEATRPDNVRANIEPASPTSPTRHRPSSASPMKSSRKVPSTSSFHGQYTVPFHQHTNSRRSSKDAALEQLEQLQLGQLSSFSRLENQGYEGGRRGSGDASLTTILVRTQTASSRTEAESPSRSPPSPYRQTIRPFPAPAQPAAPSSVPSSRSHATSTATATTNTNTGAQSPGSTRPSSVEEAGNENKEVKQNLPVLSTENPFLHPNSGPDLHGRERISHSAPDIMAIPEIAAVRESKVNSVSHITTDRGDDSDDKRGVSEQSGLRESRSRSRLRGLRFWRKRWKSPNAAAEVEPEA
jgi:hypothetical protein